MNKKNSIWLLVAVWTLVSCGTVKSTRAKPAVALAQSSLTPEQQRKYDYFFLEAMRLKEKKDYASAFGLLQHCLDIHPNAASALYEVSQYYMFLRQVPQGQEALEKAVANAPDNYWYSQGLASLYQQQNELDKAVTLLEQMVVRFPAKQDPLFNLLDLYGRQEKYDEVISTLNRLEKRMGKSSWETYIFRMARNRRLMTFIRRCWRRNPIIRWLSSRWLLTINRQGRKNSTNSSWIHCC